MTATDLEALFERYRREGDLRALGEVFDRTADELLRVARHLAKDEMDAEDLVQATYLAAIEHAERFDAGRGLVAWLAGILTNKAKLARALSLRRPDPDRLPERTGEDPALDAEMREFVQALETALDRVPESYRQILRSHLADGKKPEAIAREVDQAAGTVRVQLHRGLKHLRKWLPASFALGGLAIATSPRGLAAVRSQVLARAGTIAKAGTVGVAAGSTIPILGGALVGKKIAVAAGILLLASGGWWIATRSPRPSLGDVSVRTPKQTLDLENADAATPTLAPASTPTTRATLDGTEGAPRGEAYGSLDLQWTWRDGTPAAGIGVAAWMEDVRSGDPPLFEYADEQGRLTFEHLREGKVSLITNRNCAPASFESSVARGRRTSASFQVMTGRDVAGRVLDLEGNQVADATVWLARLNDDGGTVVARSLADGSFVVRSADIDCSLFATSPRFGSSVVESLRDRDSTASGGIRLDLKLRGSPAAVEGIVRDPEGASVAGAWVTARCGRTMSFPDTFDWPAVWTATPSDGSFRFEGLHAGKIELEVRTPGFAVSITKLTLDENGTSHVDIRLEKGFVVQGTIRAADGNPVSGATLCYRAVPAPAEGADGGWRYHWLVRTDEHGNFRLAAVPSGPTEIRVEAKLSRAMAGATTELTGKSGEVLEWNPVLEETGKIVGRVIDDSGNPLEGWSVGVWTGAQIDSMPRGGRTSADGRFEIQNCAPVPYELRAYPPDEKASSRSGMGVTMENVFPGGDVVTLVVTSSNRPTAFVHGRVLDGEGRPISSATVVIQEREGRQHASAAVDMEEGSFRVGPIPPGEYLIDVVLHGKSTVTPDPLELVAKEDRDLGTITIPAPGQFELVIRREDGTKVESPWIALVHGRMHHFLNSKDGVTFRAGNLYPGSYVLFPIGKNIATETRSVQIRSGETSKLDLVVKVGVVQDFDFQPPAGEKGPSEMNVVIRRSDGTVLFEMTTGMHRAADGTRTPSFEACFGPGRYSFEATAKGWRSAGEFDIADTSTDPPTIHAAIVRAP